LHQHSQTNIGLLRTPLSFETWRLALMQELALKLLSILNTLCGSIAPQLLQVSGVETHNEKKHVAAKLCACMFADAPTATSAGSLSG